jgi:hypothetical protein
MAAMLVVDAANVIGSRPDGWWRDRAGAARRFVDSMRRAVGDGRLDAPVVVVLEGRARDGEDEGERGGVRVVHAAGEGDDTIAEVAGEHPGAVVITADRALAERVRASGAAVRGPRWLRERIDDRRS